jgi:dolichol-phosphate mannosyltransferase
LNLSVCIPAFNEGKNLTNTIEEIILEIKKNLDIKSYEFIIVDDHSDDNSFEIINQLNKSNIRCIKLSKRSGSHVAMRAAIENANGDIALCLSADGQEDPSILSLMIEKYKSGNSIIWGIRENRNEPILQKLFASVFYKLIKKFIEPSNKNIDLANADFYLLDIKAIQAIKRCKEKNTSLFGLLIWIGFNQDQVKYHRRERKEGKSKWNFKSRMKLAKDWIIGFSAIPLKMITYVGISIAALGFIYSILIMVLSILELTTPGWAETVIIILILGGIQLTMIGVIGEYLWRTLDETRMRPNYFIQKDTKQIK